MPYVITFLLIALACTSYGLFSLMYAGEWFYASLTACLYLVLASCLGATFNRGL